MIVNKVLFYTVANGWYTKYKESWEKCIQETYPDAIVECRIIDDKGYPTKAAIARHHLEPERLKEASHVFITDIDMMICDKSFIQKQMDLIEGRNNTGIVAIGNIKTADRIAAPLMVTADWYKVTKACRNDQWSRVLRQQYNHKRFLDEQLLRKMFKTCGLTPLNKAGQFRIFHGGIHMNYYNTFSPKRLEEPRGKYYMGLYGSIKDTLKPILKAVKDDRIKQRYKNLEKMWKLYNKTKPTTPKKRRYDPDTGIFKYKHNHENKCDHNLCSKIKQIFPKQKTVWDIGCGAGYYSKHLSKLGYNIKGVEGNKNNDWVYQNILIKDLTKPLNLQPRDLLLCIEVGEHIPKDKTNIFLNNITAAAKNYIVLSWAVPGQGGIGHMNELHNKSVINLLSKKGFQYMAKETETLRNAASLSYLKQTIMVFSKKKNKPNKLHSTKSKQNLIIGFGSGRCGTFTLYKLMKQQENIYAAHENKTAPRAIGLLPWNVSRRFFDKHIPWIIRKHFTDISLTAFYFLNYIEMFNEYYKDKFNLSFIYLWREVEDTAKSFFAITNQQNSDPWTPHRKHVSPFAKCFPKYPEGTKIERIQKYVSDYHDKADKLCNSPKLKGKIHKVYYKDILNNEHYQNKILRECGIASPRVMVNRAYNDKNRHSSPGKEKKFSKVINGKVKYGQ